MWAVTFDADQTLWDFSTVLRRALEGAVAEIERLCPGVRPGAITPELLQGERDRRAAAARGRPHRLEELREESIAVVLEAHGCGDPAVAAHVARHFFRIRFEAMVPYDDVVPTLERLRGLYRLGVLTNGNSDPERCGLAGLFDATVLCPELAVLVDRDGTIGTSRGRPTMWS